MMEDEKDKIIKQEQKEAVNKVGQVAVRGVADYYSGGKYESIRNAPVVGKAVQGIEQGVGKTLGTADKLTGGQLGKQAKKLDDAGLVDMANKGLDMYGGAKNKKDVDAIKNRKGVNAGVGRTSETDSLTASSKSVTGSKSSLKNEKDGLIDKSSLSNKKDGLESENKSSSKKEKDDKPFLSNNKDGLLSDSSQKNVEGETEEEKKGKDFKKFKIIAIIAIILFLPIMIFGTLIVYLDTVADAVSNFFGISEADIEDDSGNISSGFLTSGEYLFDSEGNEYTGEESIQKLYENGDNCKITVWTKIKDFFHFGKSFSDSCAFMRYVRTLSEEKGTDVALIISSIMNGYGTQADQKEYINGEDIPDDYISSSNQYKSLEKILNSKDFEINKDTVDEIADYSITTKTFFYYEWIEKNKRTHEGECKKKIWYEKEYNLDKWKVFMRFGKKAADELDKANYTFYLREKNSEECKDINEPETFSDTFYQFADVDGKTKDAFAPYNGPYAYVEFDYKNGYAYKQFPGFEPAINSGKTLIEYDDIFTPKIVEQLIQDMVYQKVRINEILLKEDVDSTDPFASIDGVSSVSGGYCSDYLSASPDETMVSLTDCYGRYLKTVTFEDYIIGVANAEVSNTHDNYVLSEMLAAISYAYHRRNNYARGNVIQMKSGTCDQAYCSMKEGCYSVSNPDICHGCSSFYIGGSKGRNPGLYAKYQSLYRTAVKYLVVSNGRVHNAHYVSTIQNEWKRKALSGMYFTQIIAQTYASEGAEVIECMDGKSEENSQTGTTKK